MDFLNFYSLALSFVLGFFGSCLCRREAFAVPRLSVIPPRLVRVVSLPSGTHKGTVDLGTLSARKRLPALPCEDLHLMKCSYLFNEVQLFI